MVWPSRKKCLYDYQLKTWKASKRLNEIPWILWPSIFNVLDRMLSYMHINVCLFDRPASVALSDARLTGDQEVAGSILPSRQQSFFSVLSKDGQLSCRCINKQTSKQTNNSMARDGFVLLERNGNRLY